MRERMRMRFPTVRLTGTASWIQRIPRRREPSNLHLATLRGSVGLEADCLQSYLPRIPFESWARGTNGSLRAHANSSHSQKSRYATLAERYQGDQQGLYHADGICSLSCEASGEQ